MSRLFREGHTVWDRPELTADTFRAKLATGPDGPDYLRTGDLGAVVHGELYVLGRHKEMIIIRGRNHYAQDLEATATASDAVLGSDRTIAFGIEIDGQESIVLVQELTRRAYRSIDTAAVMAAMRRAVIEAHGIDVAAIVLVKPASLPRTTSGKLQRSRARALFLAGALEAAAEWRAKADAAHRQDPEPSPKAVRRERASSLRLICLPYAGGDARLFARWAKCFPPSIDVRPLNVPEPLTSWAELLAALTRECADHSTPYAIYGHSMGALIAFEWARHLRRLNGTEPVHLFVAAQHAPHLPSPYPFARSTRDPAAREVLRALFGLPRSASAHDWLLERIFTRIEPNLRLQVERYRFEQEAPLSCPVTALYGAADPVLLPWHLAAWQTHTKGPFELVNVDGGHLFVRDRADVVASLLAERLAVREAA